MARLTRAERKEQTRSELVTAARAVFLERGFHGAAVEEISERAGYTTGAVYSHWKGKDELFLALLEQRIEERAAENARFVETLVAGGGCSVDQGLRALAEHVTRREHADAEWGLLVIEFRVHAARNPDLNLRYAGLHERTLAGVARVVATIYEQAGDRPPLPPADLARLLLTVSSGARLEHATNADVLPVALLAELVAGAPSSFDMASAGGRRKRRRGA